MIFTTFLIFSSCRDDKQEQPLDSGSMQEEIIVADPLPDPMCGDGEINQLTEECDNGDSNSNTEANACRENCTLPSCGDSVLDDLTEECDDGNFWNQDGCSDQCTIEPGTMEQEPNSTLETAQEGGTVGSMQAALWEGDQDCIHFAPRENDYMSIWVEADQTEGILDEETEEITSIFSCSESIEMHLYKDGVLRSC